MPLPLSTTAISEKNKLATDSVFLVLLEIVIPGIEQTIRVVHNTEDIEWNGYTWSRVQFQLEDIRGNAAGEVPRVELRVDNTQQVLEYYIHAYETWCKNNYRQNITCTIYVINSKNLWRTVIGHSLENGRFNNGVTTPDGWSGTSLEESDADAWVTGGINNSRCVRVVRSIGSGATARTWRHTGYIEFQPPYPTQFRQTYYSKGVDIADDGGSRSSRMTAEIVLEDDSAEWHPDTDGALPVGTGDWYERAYTYQAAQGIKKIRPSFYTRYQSGIAYLDNLVTEVGGNQDPEAEYLFELLQPKANSQWATFTLGARNPFNNRYPRHRLVPICRWKDRDSNCEYAVADGTICDKTWETCKARGNTINNGGFFNTGRPGS